MENRQLVGFECDFCRSSNCRELKDTKTDLGMDGDEYGIIECLQCGLVCLFPHPAWEEILEFYRDYNSKKDRLKNESVRREKVYPDKLKKLKKYTRGRRLLDVGAGLGTFAMMAGQEGFDVTGIELSLNQCKKAKDKYGIDLLNINIFEIKNNNIGRFDVIHLHHVMEHLTSPSRMFDIAGELLNDDGVLLIEVPYQLKRIQGPVKRGKKKKKMFNFDHLFFFTPATMRNYIKEKGFLIIEFKQHRSETCKENIFYFCRYCARCIFHGLTSLLWLPSGTFLEFYCRKKRGPAKK